MKAQAAMEYLMTYGWALLIVVIVGVALWSLGVFNVNSGNVVRMTGVTSLQLIDAKATGTGTGQNVTLVVSTKRAVNNANITVSGVTCATGLNLKPGVKKTIDCNNVDVTNAMDVTFNYTDPVSGMTHSETGTLSGL